VRLQWFHLTRLASGLSENLAPVIYNISLFVRLNPIAVNSGNFGQLNNTSSLWQ